MLQKYLPQILSKVLVFSHSYIRQVIVVLMVSGLAGCFSAYTLTEKQRASIQNPSAADLAWLNKVTPSVLAWFNRHEKRFLSQGRALNAAEFKIAEQMGVHDPKRVRVFVTDDFPLPPRGPLFKPFSSSNIGGLTLGNAIIIKAKYANQHWLLSHELVHVAQKDRMGKEQFIRQYLLELKVVGGKIPLELEAYEKQY